MSARSGRIFLAASLALAPTLVLAQDRAVPRGGGDGGGSSRGGSSDSGARHPSPGAQSSGDSSYSSPGSSSSNSSSSGSGYSGLTNAQRRHPRAGSGTGSGGGYYPGYGGRGWSYYHPGYGGYWWPYSSYGWYGGYWGYPGGWGGGSVYHHVRREGGSIRVLVDPSEARVYVDGYYAGVVDDFDGLLQRLHVSPGRHEIALKLEGYKTHRMRVYVGPDATLKLHYDLQKGTGETLEDLSGGVPLPERELRREREAEDGPAADEEAAAAEERVARSGRLKLSVQPEDASVYVDGAFRGTGREAASLRLAPGRHRIEVVRPGYRTAENEVDVAPGETTRLTVTLEKPSI